MKKIKHLLAVALTLIFMLTTFTPGVSAQESGSFSQDKAIEMVKGIFDTSIYDQFNISYNEGKDRKSWGLNWSKSKEPYGSLNVNIDADTGSILNIYMYKGYEPDKKPSLIPKLSEAEAKKLAENFANKLQPKEFAQTKYQKREEPYYGPVYKRPYRQEYYFNFGRFVKDIPVVGDGFNITVDANTGDIRNYNFNWSPEQLPSPDKIIPQEAAEKVFQSKVGLKLTYQRYYDYQTKNDRIKLVYRVDDPHRALIDATTGELINEGFYDGPYYKEMGGAGGPMYEAKQAASLTPQEQKEVEATKNMISKDEAVKVINKYLTIPTGYEQTNADLYEDYDNPGQKVWNINWNKKSQQPGDYGSIHARVNAVNSELLGFNIYDEKRYQGDFKQKYDRAAAQKIAEEFLKKIQPERFAGVKLEEYPEQVKYPEKMREHYFNFTREVNGITYPENGFNINVDAQTGQVVSYNMRWHDREFPKVEGTLAKDQAERLFLKDYGLELSYVRVYMPQEQTNKYYLAYKLKQLPSYTFDAVDLKPLDYRGEPIEQKPQTAFTDIKGHWAEQDIQLLVDLGVIQATEDKFRPDDNTNQIDFIKLLLKATDRMPMIDEIALKYGKPISNSKEDDNDKYIEGAIKFGIAKKGEIEAAKDLPREKMAAFLVRSLGFEKVAVIPGIYNLPVKDAAAISPSYKGHAAIAMGLGLITGDGTNFLPKDNVTRAQAASVIVRMMKMER